MLRLIFKRKPFTQLYIFVLPIILLIINFTIHMAFEIVHRFSEDTYKLMLQVPYEENLPD